MHFNIYYKQANLYLQITMVKKFFLFCLFFCASTTSHAQNLNAFIDNNGYFYIFDNGNTTLYEYNKPVSFMVGNDVIAYFDYTNVLRIYYNGEISTPNVGIVRSYSVMNNLVIFTTDKQVYIFNKGIVNTLYEKSYNYQQKKNQVNQIA